MAFSIRRVDYFYAAVQDEPGQAYQLLAQLAESGINLLAFAAIPVGPMRAQLTLFPEQNRPLLEVARKANLPLDGPHPALLVQGDDTLGALAEVHEKLYEIGADIFASTGVTDGRGSFGYVVYVRPEEYQRAAKALGI